VRHSFAPSVRFEKIIACNCLTHEQFGNNMNEIPF
jgi:hypothetical protein